MNGYQYVAAPYTHPSDDVRLLRVRQSALACRRMVLEGANPYSPLVHCDSIERLTGTTVPYDTWIRHCLAMLGKAQTFYILCLPGWKESKGLGIEKEFAMHHGIPIGYLNPIKYCAEIE